MKKYILIILFLTLISKVDCQNVHLQTVHVKNGSKLVGKVFINSSANDSIELLTSDGKKYSFHNSEIRRISGQKANKISLYLLIGNAIQNSNQNSLPFINGGYTLSTGFNYSLKKWEAGINYQMLIMPSIEGDFNGQYTNSIPSLKINSFSLNLGYSVFRREKFDLKVIQSLSFYPIKNEIEIVPNWIMNFTYPKKVGGITAISANIRITNNLSIVSLLNFTYFKLNSSTTIDGRNNDFMNQNYDMRIVNFATGVKVLL
jgi:hypothetical protein